MSSDKVAISSIPTRAVPLDPDSLFIVSSAADGTETVEYQDFLNQIINDSPVPTEITDALALKANINNPTFTGTVGGITKSMVGLGNVDNTTDLNKPISTATQAALNAKYDASNPSGFETPAQLNTRDTNNRNRSNHTGTQLASTISDFAATVTSTVLSGLSLATSTAITAADSILSALGKLQAQVSLKYDASNPSGFETPAQLNTRDTNNRNRSNHTGTQLASTISDFSTATAATAAVTANTAKVTNQAHTGDVTGSTALTLQGTAITSKTTVTPDGADYILISDTSNGGAAAKALISSLPGAGGTPGGSNTQVQFNNSGAFGGAAALTYAASGSHLTATALSATDKPLILKGTTSQTANLQEWQNSAGTVLASISGVGNASFKTGFFQTTAGVSAHTVTVQANDAQGGGYLLRFLNNSGVLQSGFDGSGNLVMGALRSIGVDSGLMGDPRQIITAGLAGLGFQTTGAMYFAAGGTQSNITIGTTGNVLVNNFTSSTTGVTIRGAASQTANLQEWQNSAGTVLTRVQSTGKLETIEDIEITDSAKGVILKSPNATRWRITIDNTGSLTATSL